ncbi:MAG: hypothetical protein QXF12_01595 [Candidatus Aenigmatarchaeota archaeon]
MKKIEIHNDTKIIDEFIKKYERALITKSKDIRLTIEEASLLVSSLTKLLLQNNSRYYQNQEKNNITEKSDSGKEEIINIKLDFGYF